MIADLHREKKSVRQIADAIGRSPSTISRELPRNADPSGRYLPRTAGRAALERLPRPRERRLVTDAELRVVVLKLLDKRWSPEQIAHELREQLPCSHDLEDQ